MNRPSIFLIPASLLLVSACVNKVAIEYIPINNPDLAKRIIRFHHQSSLASKVENLINTRNGPSSGFICGTNLEKGSGRVISTPDEVITLFRQMAVDQPVDGILLTLANPEMYSPSDILLRNNLITACSHSGITVFVQELGVSKHQLFLARPSSVAPNP